MKLLHQIKKILTSEHGFFWIPMAAMAAAGAVKHFASDKPREDSDRKLAAETQRLSPWTHMQANPIQRASLFNSVLQGGTAGALLGAGGAFGGEGAAEATGISADVANTPSPFGGLYDENLTDQIGNTQLNPPVFGGNAPMWGNYAQAKRRGVY